MNDNIKLTIKEWINNNCLNVYEEQIKELVDAIDICSEIEIGSIGFGCTVRSEENKKIEELEKKLFALESFIQQKGFSVSYDVGKVVEHRMEACGNSHTVSNSRTYYF